MRCPSASSWFIHSGIDIVSINRFEKIFNRFERRFADQIYAPEEQWVYTCPLSILASCFAIKEATSKSLGCGLMHITTNGIPAHDIEVLLCRDAGTASIKLHRRAATYAKYVRAINFSVSFTYTGDFALALVIAMIANA